jgi:hypothetical protein
MLAVKHTLEQQNIGRMTQRMVKQASVLVYTHDY